MPKKFAIPILTATLLTACFYGDPRKDPDPYCTDESLIQPQSIGSDMSAAGADSTESGLPDMDIH